MRLKVIKKAEDYAQQCHHGDAPVQTKRGLLNKIESKFDLLQSKSYVYVANKKGFYRWTTERLGILLDR